MGAQVQPTTTHRWVQGRKPFLQVKRFTQKTESELPAPGGGRCENRQQIAWELVGKCTIEL